MNNAPIVYMWVAHYSDKQIYPQFDFETGKENTFVSIDQTKLVKFGLYPISKTLENKIAKESVVSKVLPYIVLKLNPNQRLIFVRRNYMRRFGYQLCGKCGYKWQWIPDLKEEIGESGLMIHNNHTIQRYDNKLYPLAVCPKCQTFNAVVCPDCNTLINEMEGKVNKLPHYFECPKCKKEHPRHITNLDGINQEVLYLLGYQMTVDNKNFKHIMFINESGEIELTENFEYK